MGYKMTDKCKLPKPCVPEEVPQPKQPTPAFDVCVGDWSLHWDGTHLTHTRTRTTPNGTYGTITLQDGCVVAYGEQEVPTYTPPYCNPNPLPCGQGGQVTGGGSAGGGTPAATRVTVSPKAENHLRQDSTGLYARTYINGGAGLSVNGNGTQADPYVLTLASDGGGGGGGGGGGSGGTIVAQGALESVNRNGVTYLSLKTGGVTAGKYGPLTIDRHGIITRIDEDAILLTNKNLEVSEDITLSGTDAVQIALAESSAAGTLNLGGYKVDISQGGRIKSAERISEVDSGNYKLGAYNVDINEFGSISGIVQSDVPDGAGSFKTLDGRTVTYDDTGRITKVEGTQRSESLKGPIIDVWRIHHPKPEGNVTAFVGVSIKTLMSFFGNNLEHLLLDTGEAFVVKFKLPDYVTKAEQIEIHKGLAVIVEEELDMEQKTLMFKFEEKRWADRSLERNIINIVFRG